MQRTQTKDMSVGTLIVHADTIASNARASEDFMAGIATYDTGPSDLNALDASIETLRERTATFDDLKHERDRVSAELQEREQAFRRGPFRKAVKHARYVFRTDDDARDTLRLGEGLDDVTPSYIEWRRTARHFVTRVQEEAALRGRFLAGPFTREALDALSDEMDALKRLYETREQLSADRQDARRARDAAREAVETHLSSVQDLAEILYAEHPEKLEAFGTTVPSTA